MGWEFLDEDGGGGVGNAADTPVPQPMSVADFFEGQQAADSTAAAAAAATAQLAAHSDAADESSGGGRVAGAIPHGVPAAEAAASTPEVVEETAPTRDTPPPTEQQQQSAAGVAANGEAASDRELRERQVKVAISRPSSLCLCSRAASPGSQQRDQRCCSHWHCVRILSSTLG